MSFCYDPFWKLVDSKGLSKMDVMNKTGISSTTLSRLSKNENVSMSALDKLCTTFNCKIEDVVEHMPYKTVKGAKLKFIDLFAGIGGFRIAGEENGMECVFSSEIDEAAREVYKTNFNVVPAGDITKIKAEDIPDFDILFAGFPCQPFSYAGKLKGFEDETRGTLFFDIVRVLKAKKPEMFLLENVKGLKSHDKGRTLKVIEKQLKGLGYHIHWTILNSLKYGGVPQSRDRWYCVGFKDDIHFEFPKPLDKQPILRDIVDMNNDDPKLKLTDFELKRIDHHFAVCPVDAPEQIRVKHDNSRYAPNTKKGKYGIYSYLKKDKTLRFHVGDKAKTQIQEAYYCNLDSYAPSIIAARAPKLWDLRRNLSVRECARLQGFPESFRFLNSVTQSKKQLGNAVTVPVVSRIVHNMLVDYDKHELNDHQLELLSD